ncbi:hypothetical protein D3C81_2268370 [compost metagenome]
MGMWCIGHSIVLLGDGRETVSWKKRVVVVAMGPDVSVPPVGASVLAKKHLAP